MKIMNIFGIVVAVHVAVFLLIFAIPGCRSTKPAEPAQVVGNEPSVGYQDPSYSPITSAPELSSADLNPPLAGSAPSSSASYGAAGTRYSPTRPGTPVATALSTEPVADVQPARTYTVVRGDSLWSIAKRHDVTVRELAAANNLPASAGLKIDQSLIIPGQVAAPSAAMSTASSPAAADARRYTVVAGDSLGSIARRQGTSVSALKAMNNLRSDLLRVGDVLLIPSSAPSTADVSTAVTPAPAATTAPAPTAARPSNVVQHTVLPGETLGAIARRYNVTVSAIAMANNIADPTKMRAGQSLTIPGAAAPATSTAMTSTPAARTTPPPGATAPVPSFDQDLDAGLRTDAADVPVLDVVEPVRTITLDPPPPENGSNDAPLFR